MTRVSSAADVNHLRALYQQTPASLTGNLIGTLLIIGIYLPLSDGVRVGAWASCAAVLWVLRLVHYLRYRGHRDFEIETALLGFGFHADGPIFIAYHGGQRHVHRHGRDHPMSHIAKIADLEGGTGNGLVAHLSVEKRPRRLGSLR